MCSLAMYAMDFPAVSPRCAARMHTRAWPIAKCAVWLRVLEGPSRLTLLLITMSAFFPIGVSLFSVRATVSAPLTWANRSGS